METTTTRTQDRVAVLRPDVLTVGRARKVATIQEGILRALFTCQAQNRTTIPSKSGDGSRTLSLTGNAV